MNPSLLKLKVLQAVVDAVLIPGAFALAYFLRIGFFFSTDFPFGPYMTIALLTTPLTIGVAFLTRIYKLSLSIPSWRHLQRVIFIAIQNVAVFMVLYYFAYQNFFSRLILVYIFGLTAAFMLLWHLGFRRILQLASQKEIGVCRTLIIGTNRPAQAVIRELVTVKSHLKPVAILDAYGSHLKAIEGVPVLGKMDQFERVIDEYKITHIIQADNWEQTVNITTYALQNDIGYMMPPNPLGLIQGHHTLEHIEGKPFLAVRPKQRWWERIW